MTRREYIDKLNSLLNNLDAAEKQDAISYYEDYFAEAGLSDVDEVMESVDAPEQVAENILTGMNKAEQGVFTENGYQAHENILHNEVAELKLKKERNAFLIAAIILGVLALPILVPVFGGALGLVFSILGGFFGLFFGVLCAGLSLVIVGAAVAILAITQFFAYPFAGLILLGGALVLLSLGAVIASFGIWIIVKLVPIIADAVKKLWNKITKGSKEVA